MPQTVHLLANPDARRGTAAGHIDRCVAAFRARGVDVVHAPASTALETELEATRLAEAGADRLVAMGGDGMVHIAVQALAQRETVLGLLPFGTGNDFARALGLATDFEAAIDASLGEPTPVDLMRIGTRWAASVATLGFSVAVNARANTMSWPRGKSRYTLATLLEVPKLRPERFELVFDGAAQQHDAVVVTIANTSDFGGGMRISPDAVADDGLLDITIVGATGRVELLRWFRKVFDGTHLDNPKVQTLRVRRIEINAPAGDVWADGEPVASTPTTVEAVAGALRLAGLGNAPRR